MESMLTCRDTISLRAFLCVNVETAFLFLLEKI